MSAVGLLFVLYTGIVGSGTEQVDQQIGTLLAKETGATREKKLSLDARKILARHQAEARDIVRDLATDGVVAGEITRTHEGKTLHLVVYTGEGKRKDVLELPIEGGRLSADDLATIQSNIVPDVKVLAKNKPAPPPEPKPEPKPEPEEVVEITPPPEETPPTTPETATDSAASTPLPIMADGPHLGIDGAIGIGVAARSFSPGPRSIIGYTTTPVASARFDGTLRPRPSIFLDFSAEHTLSMSSTVEGASAATEMHRWEISGGLDLLRGPVTVGALAGVGQRSFSIDSKSSARTPDGNYTYLSFGAVASLGGPKLRASAQAIFQPVIGGDTTTTDMEFGPAQRWGLDLEVVLDWHVLPAIFVRPRVSFQRFTWSFPDAGDRGAGGAVDSYFMAGVSVGASY
jgi:hypothetical protein